ncbi:hypothetical protein [Glycomyces tenuis]|uniref:hypothetical protein n=1 Tax=Glycomyces tenuis TaxID=58116 RepID=UPI000407A8E8|nr:hypothetical protein [Glycomyces tenuis]
MDEFDEFADGAGGGPDGFDEAGMDDEHPSSAFDDFDDDEVPGETDLESLAYGYGDDGEEAGLEDGIDDAFDVEADYDDEAPAAAADESAYASTYEDVLVADADNPAAFPPELDLDVPEPVDGYPWVDLDTLGSAEAEPWVNTVDSSDYVAADLDDVASEALSRFWEQ